MTSEQEAPRKILYSPGFGAGWSSWNSGEVAKFMLTYQPIIDHIETGKGPVPESLLEQLQADCKEKFGAEYVCVLGAEQLAVWTGHGPVKIDEYDGHESVTQPSDITWQ
jgi:hypothetical protein